MRIYFKGDILKAKHLNIILIWLSIITILIATIIINLR